MEGRKLASVAARSGIFNTQLDTEGIRSGSEGTQLASVAGRSTNFVSEFFGINFQLLM